MDTTQLIDAQHALLEEIDDLLVHLVYAEGTEHWTARIDPPPFRMPDWWSEKISCNEKTFNYIKCTGEIDKDIDYLAARISATILDNGFRTSRVFKEVQRHERS